MSIRAAVSADAAAFAAVHALAFETPWSAGDIRPFIDDRASFGFAAETAEGAVAGFILCRIMAGEAEILTLAVDPAHRRQGLATSLVIHAMAAARVSADSMFLEVAADDPGAIALYEKTGFEPVGRRGAYYARRGAAAVDAVVMRMTLKGSGA